MKTNIFFILLTAFLFNSCGYYNRAINTSLKNNTKSIGSSVYEVDLIQDNYGYKFYTNLNKDKLQSYFKSNPQMELIESSIKYLDDNLTIKSFQYKGLTNDELKRIQQIEKLYKKSINSGGKIAINNYQYNSTERKNNAIYDINYDDIIFWLNTHPELKYVSNEYEKIYDANGNYNGSFLKKIFVYNSSDENAKKTLCQEAIREAHKGAPFPNLSRNNISNAISACKECCKEELESRFYSDIPTLKREIFVEYFPDSKYTPAVKQQIKDIASGKMRDVSMLEAVGSAISNSEAVKVLKEIGKNSPQTDNSWEKFINVNSKQNIRFVKFDKADYTSISNIAPNVFSDAASKVNIKLFNSKGNLIKETTDLSKYFGKLEVEDFPVTLNFYFVQNEEVRTANVTISENGRITLECE